MEIAEPRHGGQQLARPQSRDPKRLALAEAVLGQKQRPARRLAKGQAERARTFEPLPQQLRHLPGRQNLKQRLRVDLPGQGHGHAVVAGIDRGRLAEARRQGRFQQK